MEGGLCREARRGVPNHHGAAPRQVGAAAAAAAATVSAIAEVEVVQEIVAAADGVGPLLRWREREEEGYSEGSGGGGGTHGWPHGVATAALSLSLSNGSPIYRTSSKGSAPRALIRLLALLGGVAHT